MIEVKNLSKHYGDKKAVDDISFTVEDGEILGFLGPNGAGKSTTMNILTGFISSTSGTASINGVDIMENPVKAKSYIGYLPEIPPLYVDMTVRAYLNFIFDLKKCKQPRNTHLKEIFELVKITEVSDRIIKNLSKGYKQRVGLAQALVGNPPVLILDEPTVGLDPKQIIEIRSLIKKLGKSHTVILSSHILPEIQAVCDRVIIINKGKLAANDTAENLSKNISDERKLVVRIEGPREEIYKSIRNMMNVVSVRADMKKGENIYDYEIEAKLNTDIRKDLNRMLYEKNWNLLMMRPDELTLEDIFLKITMGGEGVQNVMSDDKRKEAMDNVSYEFDTVEAARENASQLKKFDKDYEEEDDETLTQIKTEKELEIDRILKETEKASKETPEVVLKKGESDVKSAQNKPAAPKNNGGNRKPNGGQGKGANNNNKKKSNGGDR